MAAILEFQPGISFNPGTRPRPVLVPVAAPSRRMQGVYRRRRVVAAVLAVVLIVGVLAVGRTMALAVAPAPPGSATTAPATAAAGQTVVVVQPGDTLWAIARRLQPKGDIRPLVDSLASAHGAGPLYAGERIAVPDENG